MPSYYGDVSNRGKILQRCYCAKYGNTYIWKLPRQQKHFVLGKHWYGVVFTMIVIGGGTIANLRFLNRLQKSSPSLASNLFVFVCLMFVTVNILLVLTATTDPGIVFPEYEPTGDEAGLPLKDSISQDPLDDFERGLPEDGIPCHICKIITPADRKVGHCFDCGHCIENLDHHCPWMGQCVGKRNMRWFILFNISWVIFFVEFLYVSIILDRS